MADTTYVCLTGIVKGVQTPVKDNLEMQEGDYIIRIFWGAGVQNRADIDLSLSDAGDILVLSKKVDGIKYTGLLTLPHPVDKEPYEESYKNGVLDITFRKFLKLPLRSA